MHTLEAGIDGELLWLMVEDFNEFSAIVTNPVERLCLKKFVKMYTKSVTCFEQLPSVSSLVRPIA